MYFSANGISRCKDTDFFLNLQTKMDVKMEDFLICSPFLLNTRKICNISANFAYLSPPHLFPIFVCEDTFFDSFGDVFEDVESS